MVKKNIYQISGFFVALIVLILILVISQTNSKVVELNTEEFNEFIYSENVFAINTHTPYVGEIEGTDLIAEDWENMKTYSSQLPKDKSTPIAVYCRSGSMASVAAKQLLEMGYKNIYNLEGGMNAWQESGRQLIDTRQQTGNTKEFNILASN